MASRAGSGTRTLDRPARDPENPDPGGPKLPVSITRLALVVPVLVAGAVLVAGRRRRAARAAP